MTFSKSILNWNRTLKHTNKNDLSDRRSAATDAKAARLQAYQSAKRAAELGSEARQMERIALAEAREARRVLREQSKLEEQTRIEAQEREQDAAAAAAAAAVTADSDARAQAVDSRIARVIDDEATRKAERDQRYANRKARQA